MVQVKIQLEKMSSVGATVAQLRVDSQLIVKGLAIKNPAPGSALHRSRHLIACVCVCPIPSSIGVQSKS